MTFKEVGQAILLFIVAVIIIGFFAALQGCAKPPPKCVEAKLYYDTYWDGRQWAYWPTSVCVRYE